VGDILIVSSCCLSESLTSRPPFMGVEFSFVGDVGEPINLSIASSIAASRRGSESFAGSIVGVRDCDRAPCWATEVLDVVGVFEGEDLVGDIDLARSSRFRGQPCIKKQGCVRAETSPTPHAALAEAHRLFELVVPFFPAESLPPASCCAPRLLGLVCRPIL
jgi:hypothetical protein